MILNWKRLDLCWIIKRYVGYKEKMCWGGVGGCPEDSPSLGQRGSGTSGSRGGSALPWHGSSQGTEPGADANSLCWRWKPDGARHCSNSERPRRQLLLLSGVPCRARGSPGGHRALSDPAEAGRAAGEVTANSGLGPGTAAPKLPLELPWIWERFHLLKPRSRGCL